MSIEDRLFALAEQYTAQQGPAALADSAKLVSQLSSQAPDLHAEIRALAAAIAGDAATRIDAAGNADLEAHAIAGEIAAAQKLSMAVTQPAVAVARRLGKTPAPAMAMPAPADAGWAGDSVIAGAAPAAPPPAPAPPTGQPTPTAPYMPPIAPAASPSTPGATTGAAQPIWKNKWAIGGVAAVAALLAYQKFGKPDGATPDPSPTATYGPATPGAPNTPGVGPTVPNQPAPAPTTDTGTGGMVELAPAGSPLPTLLVKQQGQGFIVAFRFRNNPTLVIAPQGSWDGGPGTIMMARSTQTPRPDSTGGGMFVRATSDQGPLRLMRVNWQQDSLGIGPMCVAFVGTGGQDVTPAGARLCVLDGACSQPVACGQLPGRSTTTTQPGEVPGQSWLPPSP